MDRRRFLRILNTFIAVGLAIVVIWTSKPWQVWVFEGRFIVAFLGALVIDLCLVVVWAYRHALVLRAAGANVAPRDLIPLVTFSNTANNLTPAASGEVVRAWFLNRRHGIALDRAGGAILFERLFMFGLMVVSAIAAGVAAVGLAPWIIALGTVGIGVYVVLFPLMVAPLTARVANRRSRGGRIRRALVGAATRGFYLWSDRRVTIRTALWSVVAFACQGLIFWLAADLSGLALTPLQTWAVVGGGTAVGVISALPFGLGAAEVTAVGIGALIGLDGPSVAASFLLYRLFLTFPLALAGSYSYLRLTADTAAASR